MSEVIKLPVDHSQLGVMISTIKTEYPNSTTPAEIAILISDYFGVDCEEMDIIGYEEIHEIAFIQEDWELEERKLMYGHKY